MSYEHTGKNVINQLSGQDGVKEIKIRHLNNVGSNVVIGGDDLEPKPVKKVKFSPEVQASYKAWLAKQHKDQVAKATASSPSLLS